MSDSLILALDATSAFEASLLVERTLDYVKIYKVGSQLFTAIGPVGVKALGLPGLMLDLKWHDIPETVAKAVRASLPLSPHFLTVHASGGRKMVEAARRASEEAGEVRPLVIAITVLTSLDPATLLDVGFRAPYLVSRLVKSALDAGADGLVCAPKEVTYLRTLFGPEVVMITPGVRPDGSVKGSHVDTSTPTGALRAGADYVVVGRPITEASHPREAARLISEELAAASSGGGNDAAV